MLNITDLHVHYGLSHVLHGVDLAVRRGEVFGIFGRNGAGKTTLLKTIAGWVRASRGGIAFGDVALGGLRPDAISHHGVGFVPEDRRIFPGLSVDENLQMGLLQTRGLDRSQKSKAVAAMYERFPRLAERRRQAGTTLSGGEQQMLTMARAMVGKPKLLLIDEPSEGLAPMVVADIFSLIQELKAGGTTIVLVEQNMREALKVADRFCALERGRVVLQGDARDPVERDRLYAAIAV